MCRVGKGRSITSIRSAQLAPAGTIPRLAGAFLRPCLHGSDEQIFGADEQVPGRGRSDKEGFGPTVSPQLVQSGKGRIASHSALLNLPRPLMVGAFSAWDQMKPRTVYEKAVQDFTETARRLARLDQHFRQASFAEFEMLMGFDDEALKRYGLPKPMVERALIEVYQTVVLGWNHS